MTLRILFLLCASLPVIVSAQRHSEYFLVTTQHDTIYGHLKYQTSEGELHNKVVVRVNDTTKLTFKASEILYFEEGLNEYYSFVPEGQSESFFLRVWAIGPYLELFEWEVPFALSKSSLIEYRPMLRKTGETEFIKLDHKQWQKQLAELVSDFEELANDVRKKRYPMDEMNHVVDKYNEWKSEQSEGGW